MDALMENPVFEDVLDTLNLPAAIPTLSDPLVAASEPTIDPEEFVEGPTFQCGKDGTITGHVFDFGVRGCLYQLDTDVTVYKKVRRFNKDTHYTDSTVIQLIIPAETMIRAPWKRNSLAHTNFAHYNQCRAEFAVVGKLPDGYKYMSLHDSKFIYESGKKVVPEEAFGLEPDEECGNGIYFFFQPKFAEQWVF